MWECDDYTSISAIEHTYTSEHSLVPRPLSLRKGPGDEAEHRSVRDKVDVKA